MNSRDPSLSSVHLKWAQSFLWARSIIPWAQRRAHVNAGNGSLDSSLAVTTFRLQFSLWIVFQADGYFFSLLRPSADDSIKEKETKVVWSPVMVGPLLMLWHRVRSWWPVIRRELALSPAHRWCHNIGPTHILHLTLFLSLWISNCFLLQ